MWEQDMLTPLAAPCQCSRMDPEKRKNCGFPGISSDQCFASGCCFDTSIPNVPWCFDPLPKQGNPWGHPSIPWNNHQTGSRVKEEEIP